MQWPKTLIQTTDGPMEAIAPLVISASRATDIPAFHARWFMQRLSAGYCLWQNAFNPRQKQYISFEKCRIFVFWSKNPQALVPWLSEIESRGYQYYFQYTLNDYEAEGLEPNLPKLAQRMDTFRALAEQIGKERLIWRFDPIILGNTLTVERILERIQKLAEQLAPYTEKLVFSFLDMYRKTKNNLKKIDPFLRPPDASERLRLARGISAISQAISSPLALSTCAEQPDFAALKIKPNQCIDPELILSLCPDSAELHKLLAPQGRLLPQATAKGASSFSIKDKGQRSLCGCAPSKDIGRYNSCMHFCAYCYANLSKAAVMKNS